MKFIQRGERAVDSCSGYRLMSLIVVFAVTSNCGSKEASEGASSTDGTSGDAGVLAAVSDSPGETDETPGSLDGTDANGESQSMSSDSETPVANSDDVEPGEVSSESTGGELSTVNSDVDASPDLTPTLGADAGTTVTAPGPDATDQQACRYYFETICARIRECDAPTFRPCASPADLCPDILFGEGSTWTIPEILSCGETWKAHSCDDLWVDVWPACSAHPGARADGQACVFDAQCQSGTCGGGIVPGYDLNCGLCRPPGSEGSACDEITTCAMGLYCAEGFCAQVGAPEPASPPPDAGLEPTGGFVYPPCDETMACLPGQECQAGNCRFIETEPLPLDAPCSEFTECQAGMACAIEVVENEADEPQIGSCQPLGRIGEPCTPTFVRTGLCEAGGTCDGRPTGMCVPLREIGESCGYTQCVDGAYCQVYGIIDDEPSHTCYADRLAGERCFDIDFICADDLLCLCPGADCDPLAGSTCMVPAQLGEPCDERMRCAAGLLCSTNTCIQPSEPASQPAFGEPCSRSVRLGRIDGDCVLDVEGVECLCTDPECSASYCALPSLEGESCNGQTEVCRPGYVCTDEICVERGLQGLEQMSCGG